MPQNTPTVGDTSTYPMDGGAYSYVTTVPEAAAMQWLAEVAPEAQISGFNDVTVADMLARTTSRGWMNKVAVVVEVKHGLASALYMHDGDVWLIRQNRI